MKTIYVQTDKGVGELVRMDSRQPDGKYTVRMKDNKDLHSFHRAEMITQAEYEAYTVQPAKQPAKRGKKNV